MGIRLLRLGAALLALGASWGARAQTDVQRYALKRVSFQYKTTNDDRSQRCLLWLPLEEADHTIQYDTKGNPFVVLQIRGKIQKNVDAECKLVSQTRGGIKVLKSELPDERVYEVRVEPPVSTVRLKGPNFEDELVFEAPIQQFDDVNFFEFFRHSIVSFETRFAKLSSTSLVPAPVIPQKLFPIFGGDINVPFPWWRHLLVGYSMFQNLSNLTGKQETPVRYSEFAFALKLQWQGKDRWGQPRLALVGDYRGRSLYQGVAQPPFVVGSVSLPGFGFDANWYPGGTFKVFDSPVARFGISGSWRLYPKGQIGVNPIRISMWDAALNYRLSSKWAIGLGVNRITSTVNVTNNDQNARIIENINSYFLRLSLVPKGDSGL